ncbi:hypothetical protein [Bifidobacterium psychraerophilum]|uniref:hypothetical protein n=1 Tax=Bifidobacterium psychraerophilum TaxID=218140 RepID=UPI0039E82F8B
MPFTQTINGQDAEFRTYDDLNRKDAKKVVAIDKKVQSGDADALWDYVAFFAPKDRAKDIDELTLGDLRELVRRIESSSETDMGESSPSSNS